MSNKQLQHTLYLASQSPSRQQLLREAQIPFELLSQTADEAACDWGVPLPELVASIARHKMEHVDLFALDRSKKIFVLTADTLSQNENGIIQGKPKDRADAIAKIQQARGGSKLCTAFCLDKKIWRDGGWHTVERIEQVVHARYVFDIPDAWIEAYLEKSIGIHCSNAIAIEQYGGQFLKALEGSYTAIVGLPLYEVREALEKIGFFTTY